MVEYKNEPSDYIVTIVGGVVDWDNMMCNIIFRQFMDDKLTVFVPAAYFHQLLYWAWQNRIITNDRISKLTERFVWGTFRFLRADTWGDTEFDANEVRKENGDDSETECWEIAMRKETW